MLEGLRRRWRRWRHGPPPECEDCGGRANFAAAGDGGPYFCALCLDGKPFHEVPAVRDIEPRRDWA